MRYPKNNNNFDNFSCDNTFFVENKEDFLSSAYIYVYSTLVQSIPLNASISFENFSIISNFTYLCPTQIQCDVSGVYFQTIIIDTLEQINFGLYINGVVSPGLWFGANATEQKVGECVVILNAGDILEVKNKSSQGETISLNSFGTGENSILGQTIAEMSIFKIA